MLRTLFYIPDQEIAGLPLFGRGWLLLAWVIFSVILLIWLVRKQGSKAEAWGYVPLLALVGLAIWWLLPVLCKDGRGLPIRGYGVMLLLAVAAAVALAVWRARRLGLDPELILTLAFWAFVPGIIGARAFYVIEYWADFQKTTPGEALVAIVNVTEGGLVVYGSVVGGILGLVGFIYKYKMPPLATFDLVAPGFLLGMAIGRLGCLLNGCCFGATCDLPWAVTFPPDSPPYQSQVRRGQMYGFELSGDPGAQPVVEKVEPESPAGNAGLSPGAVLRSINGYSVQSAGQAHQVIADLFREQQPLIIQTEDERRFKLPAIPIPRRSLPVHPTQLYSAANALMLCLFLLAYAPFCRRDGELWATFMLLYPITRFLLEMIRVDEPGVFRTGLTISQLVSLMLLLCAMAFWAHVLMKPPGTAFARYQEPSTAG